MMKRFHLVLMVTLVVLLASGGFVYAQNGDPSPVPVDGVSLNRTTLTLVIGGQTGILRATISPTNATNPEVSWSSSNTVIASVAKISATDARITAHAPGTVVITVTTADGGLTENCIVTVTAAEATPPTGDDNRVLVIMLSVMVLMVIISQVIRVRKKRLN